MNVRDKDGTMNVRDKDGKLLGTVPLPDTMRSHGRSVFTITNADGCQYFSYPVRRYVEPAVCCTLKEARLIPGFIPAVIDCLP